MTDSARAKAVKRYTEARPDLEHQLALFARLWAIQDEFAAKALEYTAAPADGAQRALMQHQTLFSLAAPEIPLEPYRDAVRAIARLLAEDGGLPEDQSSALSEVDLGDAVSPDGLEGALAGFDAFVRVVAEATDDARLSEPLLSFVLTEAMTPFLTPPAKTAIAAAGKFDWLQWDSGLCPACGTPASSGIVRDEGDLQGGRRWLSCPLCRTQWEYARIRCARCGVRDLNQLEYLYDEEDTGHRVHTCDKCHGYSLVSFERELHAISIPQVEEIVMVRLETVAAERGFTPLGDDVTEVPN